MFCKYFLCFMEICVKILLFALSHLRSALPTPPSCSTCSSFALWQHKAWEKGEKILSFYDFSFCESKNAENMLLWRIIAESFRLATRRMTMNFFLMNPLAHLFISLRRVASSSLLRISHHRSSSSECVYGFVRRFLLHVSRWLTNCSENKESWS